MALGEDGGTFMYVSKYRHELHIGCFERVADSYAQICSLCMHLGDLKPYLSALAEVLQSLPQGTPASPKHKGLQVNCPRAGYWNLVKHAICKLAFVLQHFPECCAAMCSADSQESVVSPGVQGIPVGTPAALVQVC